MRSKVVKYTGSTILAMNIAKYVGGVISGGAARDLWYGVVPKDYDIIISKDKNPYDILEILSGTYGVSDIRFFSFYQEDGVVEEDFDRILWVFKCKYIGVEVDVISYNMEEGGNPCDLFDFNINQFTLSEVYPEDELGNPTLLSTFMGDMQYFHKSLGITSLKQIRKDVREKRNEYLREKWEVLRGHLNATQ